MAEQPNKTTARREPIFSLDVYEIQTEDGGKDHQVEVRGSYGGLGVQFQATVDQVREFFTELREKNKKPELNAVP